MDAINVKSNAIFNVRVEATTFQRLAILHVLRFVVMDLLRVMRNVIMVLIIRYLDVRRLASYNLDPFYLGLYQLQLLQHCKFHQFLMDAMLFTCSAFVFKVSNFWVKYKPIRC